MTAAPPANILGLLGDQRSSLERATIVALLRSGRRGMAAARAAGIVVADYDQPDLAALYAVIEATSDRPLIATLRFARRVLRRLHYWDDSAPRGSRGMRWSDAMLAEAAAATPGDADYAAAVLPELLDELRRVAELHRQGVAA